MKTKRSFLKLKSAWLIRWDWANPAAALVDEFACLVNYRKSAKYIKDLVEYIYYSNSLNLVENVFFAKNNKNIPYRAGSDFNGNIRCGHNPWIEAIFVKKVEVVVDKGTGIETINWETLPQYEPTVEGPKLIFPPRKEYIERKIVGPLNFSPMFDRVKGEMKDINNFV